MVETLFWANREVTAPVSGCCLGGSGRLSYVFPKRVLRDPRVQHLGPDPITLLEGPSSL